MNLKILATGRNQKVLENLCEHLQNERNYITVKCEPEKKTLFETILAEKPQVIFIILKDETRETIRSFNSIQSLSHSRNFVVIVVCDEQDEKTFIEYTELEKVLFLSRPVPLLELYSKLSEIEEQLEEAEDKGTVFREYTNTRKRKHVLVIDDEMDELMNIRAKLVDYFDVSLVTSAEMAYELLEKQIPDIMLIDFFMPEKNGSQILKEIRQVGLYSKIPAVFLSAVGERSSALKTLVEFRPQSHILKTASKVELVTRIVEVLG